MPEYNFSKSHEAYELAKQALKTTKSNESVNLVNEIELKQAISLYSQQKYQQSLHKLAFLVSQSGFGGS